jgi:hypothetical protein
MGERDAVVYGLGPAKEVPIVNNPLQRLSVLAVPLALAVATPARAADQTHPGAGNARAVALAAASPLISSGRRALERHIERISDPALRHVTREALFDPNVCVLHRADMTEADKDAIVQALLDAGLVKAGEAANFPGGAKAGVFPPVLDDGSRCPRLPQRFFSAPGSGTGGHHTYPGGLVVHESFNSLSNLSFATNYRRVFGHSGADGLAEIDGPVPRHDVAIVEDVMIAAPLWHDWAKAIVFQWNADGSEFAELHIGGTGGHHIIGVAETMKRGLPADFVVTQVSAHAGPTEGNEPEVVGWLRAAAIIARIDPVAHGYLRVDGNGQLRLPIVRQLGGGIDLNAAGRTNLLVEYVLHNLSDADWILAEPAVDMAELLLQTLAPELGVDPNGADYTNRFRNPALSYLSAERLVMLYGNGGLAAVRAELGRLRARGII